ncbi:hypothetical protein J3Q64DRAFT_1070560 [Phycomyces blakesleeanus]|uniref:DIS3-like exonuclease 2 n=2 Tax=Phycomyces blakesleeanus TaxID=4837 RepID=A0A162V2U8_PHYB8|nr:hypothetical protein PHYBLDRAFT_75561 [Phycomyces blakesleeanus NRRL 1555(-)]OAD79573.1 hypothetical protein PHYBLDRAFT_75561 [Phycomyces blakesleeanus NRRL 1555(-)]|eukprot:XP_018297613.1 hypothetical protein PHYBLDRAFT_75561 [Phycomyces blakesleeanus NRRL 1555(-)]
MPKEVVAEKIVKKKEIVDEKSSDKNLDDSSEKSSRKQDRVVVKLPKPSYVHPDDHIHTKRKALFAPFMSPKDIKVEIRQGKLYSGTLRINKRNRQESYVTTDSLDGDVFICGQHDRNRALDGDIVAVRLIDPEKAMEKKREHDMRRRDEKNRAQDKNGDPSVGKRNNTADDTKPKSKFFGVVVGIISRVENPAFSGTIDIERSQQKSKKDSDNKSRPNEKDKHKAHPFWFKPTDLRVPFIMIATRNVPPGLLKNEAKFKDHIVVVELVEWPIDSAFPFGKIIQDIGQVGELKTEAKAVMLDNRIKDSPFSPKVLNSLPSTPWTIPVKEYKKRRDLRDTRVFSIDPATAKDLDDALHVQPLEDGNIEVGVHIADVSFFLKTHTALDAEAYDRATSTYLVDSVIPMLPSLLCEELCSLNAGVERLSFSVIWKMDLKGNILDTWFGRTIIKSCAKLSYDDAQSVIDGNKLPSTVKLAGHTTDNVESDIIHLYKLSKHMRSRRFENGALSMNSIRLSFNLDDNGDPVGVWIYEMKESNRLIEEFMLRANMSVAEKISEAYPEQALLRRHIPPIERRMEEFLGLARELGYTLDASTAGTLQASFDAIEAKDIQTVLKILAIKSMQRAKYFCTGSFEPEKYSHYALNVPLYTHFTSPIRRYADVIVHRQLECALQKKAGCGYQKEDVERIALRCNQKKDGAKNAQDQSIQLYLARYLDIMEKKGSIISPAIVLQVTSEGFDVLVPEYGLEKRINVKSLPLEKFKHNPEELCIDMYWKKNSIPCREKPEKPSDDDSETDSKSSIEQIPDTDIVDTRPLDNIPGIPVVKLSQESVMEVAVYSSENLQKVKPFTRLDVLIQAEMNRSPPIINVYPVNPFATYPKTFPKI